jgi:hypothetical protein
MDQELSPATGHVPIGLTNQDSRCAGAKTPAFLGATQRDLLSAFKAWLVWADAALRFIDPTFLAEQAKRLGSLPPQQRLLLVPHPERQTVREE